MKEIDELHLVTREVSEYNEISVYETTELYGEMGKFRCLQFADGAIQGAVDLKHASRIILEYPRAIIHILTHNHPYLQKGFLIGHGIGTIVGHFPDKRFTVAEIDAQVVEVSRRYFNYRSDHVLIGDGRELLEKEAANALDAVIVDAFSAKGTPPHLVTKPFFELAKEKLNVRGTMIMNLMGRPRNDKRIAAILTTLKAVFTETKALMLPGAETSGLRNIILIGSGRPIEFDMRQMAGFVEMEWEQGHLLLDRSTEQHC
nr:fused MFS/spermidine synthase [Paenibacillus solanacearum]